MTTQLKAIVLSPLEIEAILRKDSPATEIWRPYYAGARQPFGLPGVVLYGKEALRYRSSGWVYDLDKKAVVLPKNHPRVPEMVSWAHHTDPDDFVSGRLPATRAPQFSSRIFLRVESVRFPRLVRDITRDEVSRAGFPYRGEMDDYANAINSTFLGAWDARWRKKAPLEIARAWVLAFTRVPDPDAPPRRLRSVR